jgi:3-oxoacyl-[acyl-carrier protein] reductase
MKTAVITGASRGIGKAIASTLASENINLIITYKQSKSAAQELKQKLESEYSIEVNVIQADLADSSSRENLSKEIKAQTDSIDYLINNAGVLHRQEFQDTTEEIWDQTLNVNLKSIFFLCKSLQENINPGGCIVNISSIAGLIPLADSIEYGISKAGLIYLTKSLAKVFAPDVRVNCVCPGRVDTDMTGYSENPEKKRKREANIPLGQVLEPGDIADIVKSLISEQASQIKGQAISVDGGELLN